MAQRGGKREGSGRKTKAEELKVSNLAIESITEHYGGLKEGLMALLETKEPSLIKFVFEHALGKPKDNVNVQGNLGITWKEEKTYAPKP